MPDDYIHFNRTRSKAEITYGDTAEKSMEFDFMGSHFALVGNTNQCGFDVYVDGELLEAAETSGAKARQCFYSADVPTGSHSVKIVVTSGSFAIDVIEY